jgi:hypothetical protein
LFFMMAVVPVQAAVEVSIDYRFDSSGFFNNLPARLALEKGIQHIASKLQDQLLAITPGPTPFGFANEFDATFQNPSTGASTQVEDLTVPANTLILFVGARDLPNNTLGQGGPGGFGGSGTADFLQIVRRRGQGVTTGANAVDFAPWGGTLTFDSLTDWSYDTSSNDPGGTKHSFISVVEHEFGHVLGIGTAPSWDNKVLAAEGDLFFTGSASVASNGGNVPLEDDAHWADDVSSFVGPNSQLAVMNATLTQGTRRRFTELDFAALTDVGWEVVAVPEASSWILVGSAVLFCVGRRRRTCR